MQFPDLLSYHLLAGVAGLSLDSFILSYILNRGDVVPKISYWSQTPVTTI